MKKCKIRAIIETTFDKSGIQAKVIIKKDFMAKCRLHFIWYNTHIKRKVGMDMTYQQLVKIINSAGAWFVGSFMGEFVINYPKFCNDLNRKADFIDYIPWLDANARCAVCDSLRAALRAVARLHSACGRLLCRIWRTFGAIKKLWKLFIKFQGSSE